MGHSWVIYGSESCAFFRDGIHPRHAALLLLAKDGRSVRAVPAWAPRVCRRRAVRPSDKGRARAEGRGPSARIGAPVSAGQGRGRGHALVLPRKSAGPGRARVERGPRGVDQIPLVTRFRSDPGRGPSRRAAMPRPEPFSSFPSPDSDAFVDSFVSPRPRQRAAPGGVRQRTRSASMQKQVCRAARPRVCPARPRPRERATQPASAPHGRLCQRVFLPCRRT